MIHWNARRLLPQVLDGTLPPLEEGLVREHAGGCRRCGRVLAELEACERLLQQLPVSLVPLEEPAGRVDRLMALSRWILDPEPSWGERLGMSALGAFAAAAVLAVALTGGSLPPPHQAPESPLALASVVAFPDSELVMMGRWR